MVGGMEGEEREVESRITKEVIELKKGDRIYMASDGYQDQFGGENDKKFMTKRLKSMFENMANKPMGEQDSIIEDEFNSWKGDRAQTDDVIVIGAEF
jgi:serine phosphatase RsbU (regulator of sigma subunit)